MHKLYEKSELAFFFAWLVIYIVCSSLFDSLSSLIGVEKLFTAVFHSLMSFSALFWMKKHDLLKKYGIVKPNASSSRFLFYIPLVIIVSCNVWFGVMLNYSVMETLLYIISMIGVGFLEEFIFRGLLFRAMEKNGLYSAIIVSSITFGIGHIINLFNGSGADILSNLCQIISAVAFGFLFVVIFYRSQSLLPCIATHSAINALSVISKETTLSSGVVSSLIITVIAIAYTLVLLKTLPKSN
ncbi:MAG: CPBP family intramembrane metalloprotease [Ruminococcaceae bacterium]|nr:CPBP family intramembrane metalloprotease [Oscillospiraceae bacterium]